MADTANETDPGAVVTVYAGEVATLSEGAISGSGETYLKSFSCTGNANPLVGAALTKIRVLPARVRSAENSRALVRTRNSDGADGAATLNIAELEARSRDELIDIARDVGIDNPAAIRKPDLVFRILQLQAEAHGNIFSGGFLEVSDDGNYGFLRGESMLPGPHDIYVSQSQLRRFALRPGDYVTGQVRAPRDNEKYYGLLKVEAVNGMDPEAAKRRPFFENLTAIFPNQQLHLETTDGQPLTCRIIDP